VTAPRLLTFCDVQDTLEALCSGYGVSAPPDVLKRCVLDAYNEVVSLHDWSCLYRNGRIQLHAPQTTGTVTFDLTGGTYERQLTLAGSTWPTWAEDAAVRFGDIVCDIESRKSSTVVTLDATMCPGTDVASTTYTLYPRWYRLPSDCVSISRPHGETSWAIGECISPEQMLSLDRYEDCTGDIEYYAVAAAPDLYGQMALYVHPASDADKTFDFLYKRRPRDLRYSGKETACTAGTIAVTAGSATVTGTSTTFDASMVGSIFRIGTSTTNPPTGVEGQYPWVDERCVIDVTSATSLTLDAAVTTTRSGVKYRISDPIDLDVSLHNAFQRLCERNLARARNVDGQGNFEHYAKTAVFQAKCADARVGQRRVAGTPQVYLTRLADASSRPSDTAL
jgi:hypothetical protein